jgi:hypothetical protein
MSHNNFDSVPPLHILTKQKIRYYLITSIVSSSMTVLNFEWKFLFFQFQVVLVMAWSVLLPFDLYVAIMTWAKRLRPL